MSQEFAILGVDVDIRVGLHDDDAMVATARLIHIDRRQLTTRPGVVAR